jgi:DNA ligase (NAD+)
MINVEELKSQITFHNQQYREGNPVISDETYDVLVESLKNEMFDNEFIQFRKTLTEHVGSTKSGYVLGSLEKYKYEESEDFQKWVSKHIKKSLFISEKVDGASFFAVYEKGKLVSCLSRGDGITGTDWTDKANYILPKTIPYQNKLDIRGEFTLHSESLEVLPYKNTRNGTVGILNSKEVEPEKLCYVFGYVYEIISSKLNPLDQFRYVEELGFKTPKYISTRKDFPQLHEELKRVYFDWKKTAEYAIDGLVLSDISYQREDVFLPEGKVAFKINDYGKETMVNGITWEVSKGNKLIPVCNIQPIELDGTTVSNVTGIHARYISENMIGVGAVIRVNKSGEIIPKILEVVAPVDYSDSILPTSCPECGGNVSWEGVNLVCPNESCGSTKRVESFIKSIGIENVSETTLKNWNINSFEELLSWNPDSSYKTQTNFFEALNDVFKKAPHEIMKHFPINGIGKRNFDKLFQHYGSLSNVNDVFEKQNYTLLPAGIGDLTIQNASSDWKKYYSLLQQFLADSRYCYVEQQKKEGEEMKLTGKSFLLTGTMSRKRSVIEQEIVENGGFIASSVSKNLSYLIAASEESGSTKFKKATQLGIPIISEQQYLEMLKG